MGLYDEIHYEKPMPDGYEAKDHIYQTKDLGCWMRNYEITEDGYLVRKELAYGKEIQLLDMCDYDPERKEIHDYRLICEVKVLRIEPIR